MRFALSLTFAAVLAIAAVALGRPAVALAQPLACLDPAAPLRLPPNLKFSPASGTAAALAGTWAGTLGDAVDQALIVESAPSGEFVTIVYAVGWPRAGAAGDWTGFPATVRQMARFEGSALAVNLRALDATVTITPVGDGTLVVEWKPLLAPAIGGRLVKVEGPLPCPTEADPALAFALEPIGRQPPEPEDVLAYVVPYHIRLTGFDAAPQPDALDSRAFRQPPESRGFGTRPGPGASFVLVLYLADTQGPATLTVGYVLPDGRRADLTFDYRP